MSILGLLAQAVPTPPPNPSIPVDEGSFGISVVMAVLITLLIMVLVCSPIRRD